MLHNLFMPFVMVASVSTLPKGSVVQAEANGETYAICNVNGEIHAFEGSCPCTGGPLGLGALRENLLVCPWHGWRYDYRTGVSAYNANIRITKIPVKVEGDDILIDLPERRAR